MKTYQVILLTNDLASDLHEDWRRQHEAQKGVGAPRWKPTIDEKWAVTADASIRRGVPGAYEVNINSPFTGLPFDWQADNAAAAQTAVALVLHAHTLGEKVSDDKVIELLASDVHTEWVKRQEAKEVLEAFEKGITLVEVQAESYFRKQKLDLAYDQLPDAEKEKDRAHLRLAIAKLGL